MKTVFQCPQCSQICFRTSSNCDSFKVCPSCGEMMQIMTYKYEPAEREWLDSLKKYRDYEGNNG